LIEYNNDCICLKNQFPNPKENQNFIEELY